MAWHIHKLIDPETGEIIDYDPARDVVEIIQAVKEEQARIRLHKLRELGKLPKRPDVDALARNLFDPKKKR